MPAAAVALQSRTVIAENVPGIIHGRRGVVQAARRLFQNAGYLVEEKVVDVLRLGVPQTRKRHLLVASKYATSPIQVALECLERLGRTLEWAIGDLLDCVPDSLFDSPLEPSVENRQRIQYLSDTKRTIGRTRYAQRATRSAMRARPCTGDLNGTSQQE